MDDAVVGESWGLLKEALVSKREAVAGTMPAMVMGTEDDEASDGESRIDLEEFPVLFEARVHAELVGGLAANLMDVEVSFGGSAMLWKCTIFHVFFRGCR